MNLLVRLRSGWNALKLLRVVLGSLILSSAILSRDGSGIAIGLLFTLLSLFTDGVCCAGGACSTAMPGQKNKNEEIEYEELDTKK